MVSRKLTDYLLQNEALAAIIHRAPHRLCSLTYLVGTNQHTEARVMKRLPAARQYL